MSQQLDDPSRIRRSRDIGAYLGLVPRRYQSGEVDYTGGISKCGDGRVQTLLYEPTNVMLSRNKGQINLKDWAFAIAKRSTMRKARVALARRLAIIVHERLRDGTKYVPNRPKNKTREGGRIQLQEERRPKEGADDGADSVACGLRLATAISIAALHLAYPIERQPRAREHSHPKASTTKSLRP